jgi:hypothetical protein
MDGAILADQREFQCSHCHGRIVIPLKLPSTTGPCPHCGAIIISPAPVLVDPTPLKSAPLNTTVAASESTVATVTGQNAAELQPPLPGKPEHQTQVAPQPPPRRRSSRAFLTAMGIAAVLIAGAGVAVYYILHDYGRNAPSPSFISAAPGVAQSQYLRTGWQVEANQVLRQYLAAATEPEKCKSVLGGNAMSSRMEAFYGGCRIDDSDTPAEAFSTFALSMEDEKRGMFLMIYDRPPQFNIREFFRPLASLEVQYGVEDADVLLGSFALASNFSLDPVRVPAFFKKTETGLKLDWETFAQAKYHTFRNFLDLPEGGRSGVFRLLIVEEVPEQGRAVAGTRRYRVADPTNITDSARINVPIDSEIGRFLSGINWRGVKDATPKTRTVTLELSWDGDQTPELHISKFICWEFLGLGGEPVPAGR